MIAIGCGKTKKTAALNHIVELVLRKLKLGLVDMQRGAYIHVDASNLDCSAIMV